METGRKRSGNVRGNAVRYRYRFPSPLGGSGNGNGNDDRQVGAILRLIRSRGQVNASRSARHVEDENRSLWAEWSPRAARDPTDSWAPAGASTGRAPSTGSGRRRQAGQWTAHVTGLRRHRRMAMTCSRSSARQAVRSSINSGCRSNRSDWQPGAHRRRRARRRRGLPVRSGLPAKGRFRRERPRAMGVTPKHPLRRKTAGFRGVAPGTTGGAIPSRPLLSKDAIRSVTTGRSGAPTPPARCDSGRDRGALSESHAGAAN